MIRKNSWKMVIIIILMFCSGCSATYNKNSNSSEQPTATTQIYTPNTDQNSSTAQPSPSEYITTPVPSPISTVNPPSTLAAKQIIINEKSDETKGTFYIGQSHLDVLKTLNEFNIKIVDDTDTDIDAGKLGFSFNNEDYVYAISVTSKSSIATSSGLNFGASYEEMVKIYGTNYTTREFPPDVTEYYYKMGDHYLYVDLSDDKMCSWGVIKTKANVKLGQ